MAAMHKRGVTAIWIGLISNILLCLMKITAGLLLASPVLLADGINNGGDILATLVALSSSIISRKPADDDHPYGHGKAEVIASALVAIILALAALWICAEAVRALFGEPKPESSLALLAASVSLVWKLALYVYTVRIGRAAKSKSVLATAYDHLADVYTSLAAVTGITLAILGGQYGWTWAAYGDPAASIIVSLLILRLAYKMAREAADILMEKNAPKEKLDRYCELIGKISHIKQIERVRAREHGHYITVDVHIVIPGGFTVQQGHDICCQVRELIMEDDPDVVEVLVHLSPWHPESAVPESHAPINQTKVGAGG